MLGLVVLAASIGPGYVWVRVAETRVPRGARTQLLEVAELIIIGGLFSTLGFLAVLSLAPWIDTDALADQGFDYVIRHPTRSLSVVLVGLLVACAASYALARWGVYRNRPTIISHGESAWYGSLRPRPDKDRLTYATVDLRDGTSIAGWVGQVTTDEVPLAERDLALIATLGKPVKIRPPGAPRFWDSPDSAVILNGADVFCVSASSHSIAAEKAALLKFEQALAEVVADKADRKG